MAKINAAETSNIGHPLITMKMELVEKMLQKYCAGMSPEEIARRCERQMIPPPGNETYFERYTLDGKTILEVFLVYKHGTYKWNLRRFK